MCRRIRSLSPDEVEKLKVRRNQVTGDIEMECFMTRMDEYLKVREMVGDLKMTSNLHRVQWKHKAEISTMFSS